MSFKDFTRSLNRPQFEHVDGRTIRRVPIGGWQAYNAAGEKVGRRCSGLPETERQFPDLVSHLTKHFDRNERADVWTVRLARSCRSTCVFASWIYGVERSEELARSFHAELNSGVAWQIAFDALPLK